MTLSLSALSLVRTVIFKKIIGILIYNKTIQDGVKQVQIIKEDFSEVFFNLAADSKYSIKLCSPNVSEKAMQNLYQVSSNTIPKELITNMNIKHFYDKSSEIEAIDTMMEHSHNVYNNQTLHANLYIFDNQKAIVTSANFNLKGLKSVEMNYGLLVTDTALVDEMLADFVGIKRNTEKTSLLEPSHISKTKKLLEKLYSSRNSMDKFPVIDERKIKELLPLLSSWQKNVTQCILSGASIILCK